MDVKEYSSVTVYNIDNAGKLVDKYAGRKCQVRCSYDPAGLSVRIIPGKCGRSEVLACHLRVASFFVQKLHCN